MVCNNARVEGCIAEAFTCKEITNFSNMYFSHSKNMNAPTTQYHVVIDVPLSELSIFQWKGTGGGATSAHYVSDKEWNYSMLYLYTNMVEVNPYFEKFDKNILDISHATHIEVTGSHARAYAQRWSKLSKVVPTTCNLSFHFFLSYFYFINHLKCVMLCIALYIVYVGCQCFQ
jgi:hypothetical protein